jgi:hypothetical protein
LVPNSTNFLVDINGRTLQERKLCGATAILSASNGYNSIPGPQALLEPISTSQTYTATGIYYVSSTSTTGCTSIKEEINLIPFEIQLPILLHDQLQIK